VEGQLLVTEPVHLLHQHQPQHPGRHSPPWRPFQGS
jgi:hypothetical protein